MSEGTCEKNVPPIVCGFAPSKSLQCLTVHTGARLEERVRKTELDLVRNYTVLIFQMFEELWALENWDHSSQARKTQSC